MRDVSPSPSYDSHSMKLSTIQLRRTESILDLTDSEDELDNDNDNDDQTEETISIIAEDSSLRHLIRVTSHTLSEEGKVMEEEALIEWEQQHPQNQKNAIMTEDDSENDGLDQELKRLNDRKCHNEISFAMDQVAYNHVSTSDIAEKFTPRKVKGSNNTPSDIDVMMMKADSRNAENDLTDQLLNMCSTCCGKSEKQI